MLLNVHAIVLKLTQLGGYWGCRDLSGFFYREFTVFTPLRAYHNPTSLIRSVDNLPLVGLSGSERSEYGTGHLIMEQSSATSERLVLLTAREAAGYLRVSLSTLYRMEQRGLLKPLRTPGGHRRYTLEMLNESLSQSSLEQGE